jgi:hypothetical protein
VTDAVAMVRTALIKQFENLPELSDEVLARVAAVPYTGDTDAYLQAVTSVTTTLLEDTLAAMKAKKREEDEVLEAQIAACIAQLMWFCDLKTPPRMF